MLNEEVIKKLKNVPNNAILELSKKASKDDLEKVISATIVDNKISETTTYSSVKLEDLLKVSEDKLNDIEELKETNNIKCTTNIGEYTIENSKKGYLTNFNLEGKTLVNLANPNNIYTTDGVRYNNPFNYIESGKTYTFVNLCDKQIKYTYGGIGNVTVPASSRVLYTIPNTVLDIPAMMCYGHTTEGWGETDLDKQKISKAMLVLEGDYTSEDITYFEGLQSVGQVDNMELFSCKEDNIIPNDITWKNGYFLSRNDSLEYESANYSYTLDYIPVKADTNYTLVYANWNVLFYDKDKNKISFAEQNPYININGLDKTSEGVFFIKTPPNSCYMRISAPTRYKDRLTISEGFKFDKKIIPYALRSLPSGVKDEIVYKNGCYKLIKRCEEHTYTDIGNLDLSYTYDNTLCFMGTLIPQAIIDSLDITYVLCNSLSGKSRNDFNNNDTEGCSTTGMGDIAFRILKSKLSTQDKNGFNEWIKKNPITIIYQLAEPEEIELGALNLEQYNNQTKFICKSGIVPSISFESTQNLGSHIEAIRSNVKSLSYMQISTNTIDLSNLLVNGWIPRSSLNPQEFGCIFNKIDDIVHVNMRVYNGLVDKNTIVLNLPQILLPKHFVVFKIFNSKGNPITGNMYIDIETGCIKIGNTLSSNEDIIIMGHYYLN
ncbi:hypothetical protein CDFC105_72649 [Clostridioides difficile]|nr:hypothetical protein CDFC105_60358 [Clostridioides difficile]CZS07968.1 hypothetical protein CDFC105_72649 [Clostridioides difficile]